MKPPTPDMSLPTDGGAGDVAVRREREHREEYDRRYRVGYMQAWPEGKKRRVAGFVRSLGLPSTGVALDFGCGTGEFTALLQATLPGWEVWGVELSPEAARIAREKVPDARFVDPAVLRDSAPRFDLIFSHHVLEHVEDLDQTFSGLNRLLLPGGHMVHILPCGNPGSLEHTVCGWRNGGIDAASGRFFFEEPGHLRRADTATFLRLAHAGGLRLVGERYSGHFFGGLSWITGASPHTVLPMCSPRGVRAGAWPQLLAFSAVVMLLNGVRFPEFFRTRNHARTLAGASSRVERAMAGFLWPAAWISGACARLLERLADREWVRRGAGRGGSEMYLHLLKEP